MIQMKLLYILKPDKTVVFQDKEIELLDKTKGKIKVLLTTQTLVKAGDVEGEISIGRVENGTKNVQVPMVLVSKYVLHSLQTIQLNLQMSFKCLISY